eukprot:14906098-Alexandrium_andersonii.AAC.1
MLGPWPPWAGSLGPELALTRGLSDRLGGRVHGPLPHFAVGSSRGRHHGCRRTHAPANCGSAR